jgi:hypothetical protein
MILAKKVRIKPTSGQERQLWRYAGATVGYTIGHWHSRKKTTETAESSFLTVNCEKN